MMFFMYVHKQILLLDAPTDTDMLPLCEDDILCEIVTPNGLSTIIELTMAGS